MEEWHFLSWVWCEFLKVAGVHVLVRIPCLLILKPCLIIFFLIPSQLVEGHFWWWSLQYISFQSISCKCIFIIPNIWWMYIFKFKPVITMSTVNFMSCGLLYHCSSEVSSRESLWAVLLLLLVHLCLSGKVRSLPSVPRGLPVWRWTHVRWGALCACGAMWLRSGRALLQGQF